MRLTQTSEYALRVLTYMATLPKGEAVQTARLASILNIPPHYLAKIMRRLVNAGLLSSRKGRGGGFVFAKPLVEIRFKDILEAVGYEVDNLPCVFGWPECSDERPCPLHLFWRDLKSSFRDWASNHHLSEVKPGSQLDS